jgi:pimeloyl-ACP methyl ester carboxylesterase
MTPGTTVLRDGVRLVHSEVGVGSTILFHQGFSLTQLIWEPLLEHLTTSYRCITFDPRGHGASTAPASGYTVERLAEDLTELARALDLHDVTLVGHSLGGAAALTAVADQGRNGPFSRLVLLGPALPAFVQRGAQPYGLPPELFAELRHSIQTDFAANARQTADIFFHQTDPRQARRIFDATLAMRPDVATELFTRLGDLDLTDRLGDVIVPVLALWGEHDVLSDPRWADWFQDQKLPHWHIGTLPNSGHGPMVDEPAELAARIREFVDHHPRST